MFGYIKPFTPELKMKEYDAFRGVYCGLCHQLGRSFGMLTRLTLNYDFVFLAMLFYAEQDEMPVITQGRCCVNPLQKVPLCQSKKGLVYSADIAALMIHYKADDNVQDSRGFAKLGWKILRRYQRSHWIRASEREPKADNIIAEMMKKQQLVEQEKSSSLDAACEPTAWALSQISKNMIKEPGEKQNSLERLGYLVGRYIYLCDAMEDLPKDLKTGNYNPLIYRYLTEDRDQTAITNAQQEAKASIYMTIGEMGRLCDKIEFAYFTPIIHNIIQFGMRQSADEILYKKGGASNEKPL